MNKYIIEGGIDFYEELYKSLDIEETNEKTEEDNNLCLITNQPLSDKFVILECSHKFNYVPLFLDIKNHKQKFNSLEGTSSRLNIDEIRCPYCREKQKGVLPYYEELGLEKINGVNIVNPYTSSSSHSYSCYKPCEYLKPNPEYDPSGNEPIETNKLNKGNCKFHICFSSGTSIGYGSVNSENYGDGKSYCWLHKKEMIKKYKQEIKIKAKEEANKEKLKLKEEAKKAKEEAKLKEKEEKKKLKEEVKKSKQNTSQENVVLGLIDLSGNNVTVGCTEILKSGQNKGKQCGCKIVSQDVTLCSRHFKIKYKIVMNNI
jgi:hypothetical protein